MKVYDLAVLGVGGMGAAVVAHGARRGISVLGLEQYSLPHKRGSSHGVTRILRLGLHEGPTYVPLVLRAVELWQQLGSQIGEQMFFNNGSFDVAPPESPIFKGSLAACVKHSIAHEILDATEIHRRFPGITPDREMLAVFQPGSGFVLSDSSMEAHLNIALALGADLHGHEAVTGCETKGDLIEITTNRSRYQAKSVVVTTGAWANQLVKTIPVKTERQVVGWFQPKESPELFRPDRMPSWIIDSPTLGHFYGLPIHKIPGFKLSKFFYGDEVNPSGPILSPQLQEEEVMRVFLRKYFPKADGPVMSLGSTFFENTPDRDFIIDHLPGQPNFWLALGFSGHGYKYCPAIGEMMVDLATQGRTTFDLSPFRLSRFNLAHSCPTS